MDDPYTAALVRQRDAVACGEQAFLNDLFNVRPSDPETSHEAAALHPDHRAEQRRKLLAAFDAAGAAGLTADEADTACDFYTGTAGRRLHELEAAGSIHRTTDTRATRRGGRGVVYVHASHIGKHASRIGNEGAA